MIQRDRKPTLGYLTSIYARASDTFVRAEVLGLRGRGYTVFTYSVRRPDADQLVSEEIRREHDNTLYVLPDQKLAAMLTALRVCFTRPLRMLNAALLAWRTGTPGLRGRLRHLAYLIEAAFLAERMRADGVQHFHNHLGESSATVAMLSSVISGIPFSLAVHGPYIFRNPIGWALDEKIRRSAFTTCITDFTRSQCMIYASADQWPKLVTVRCGPDPRFLEGERPALPSERHFVWVGRVCEEKGVPLLVEAAERLAAEGQDFALSLLGDGPLRAALEARVRERGLSERIRFLGWASSDRVRQAMLDARVLVLPSFAEGLPVVIMEALALGRPVISTFVAGIPELVETGACGWMVPAGSVDQLCAAMRSAIEASDVELERLGEEGRRRIRERHQLADQLDVLEQAIVATLAGRAPGTPRDIEAVRAA